MSDDARLLAECNELLAKHRRQLLQRRVAAAAFAIVCIVMTCFAFASDQTGYQVLNGTLAAVYLALAGNQLHQAEPVADERDRLREKVAALKRLLQEIEDPPTR